MAGAKGTHLLTARPSLHWGPAECLSQPAPTRKILRNEGDAGGGQSEKQTRMERGVGMDGQ